MPSVAKTEAAASSPSYANQTPVSARSATGTKGVQSKGTQSANKSRKNDADGRKQQYHVALAAFRASLVAFYSEKAPLKGMPRLLMTWLNFVVRCMMYVLASSQGIGNITTI